MRIPRPAVVVARCLPVVGMVVLACAAVPVAAGGNGDPKHRLTAADQARARSVLLRRADLGSGFVARPAAKDDLPAGVRCGPLDESDLTVSGDAASSDFTLDRQGVLLTVGSSAQVYVTQRDAAQSWKRGTSKAAVTCLADIVARSAGPGQRVEVLSATRLAFPRVAPLTTAYRIVARLRSGSASVKVWFDAVVLQRGRVQAGVVFTSAGGPVGTTDQVALARIVAGRLARATGVPSGPVA